MLKPLDYLIGNNNLYTCFNSHCVGVETDSKQNLYFIQKIKNVQETIENSSKEKNIIFDSIQNKYLADILENLENVFSDTFDVLSFLQKYPILCNTKTAETLFSAKDMLKDLYALYLCYISTVWGSEVKKSDFLCFIDAAIEEFGIAERSDNIYTDYIVTSASLADISCNTFIVPGENNTLCVNRIFDDQFSALKYMLLEYIMMGEAGISGHSIHHCEACGKEFIRESKKKHLCNFCGSASQRTKLCRERKAKEEAAK